MESHFKFNPESLNIGTFECFDQMNISLHFKIKGFRGELIFSFSEMTVHFSFLQRPVMSPEFLSSRMIDGILIKTQFERKTLTNFRGL